MAGERQIESMSSFYDTIAEEYNGYLTQADERVRNEVRQLFTKHVQQGVVLDFGGGTGLDLPWLAQNFRQIYFLEPSVNMRRVAERNSPSHSNITFVNERINFNEWNSECLPFTDKVDGVIANFAVLNCIRNIDQFFNRITLTANDSCYLVLTVIDPRPSMIMKNYSAVTALRILFSRGLTLLQQHKDTYHETYIHSLSSIKRASSKHFKLKAFIPLEFSTFAVLIFSRK